MASLNKTIRRIYPDHLQGVTSLVNVYSVFGNFSYITAEYIYICIYICTVIRQLSTTNCQIRCTLRPDFQLLEDGQDV